MRNSCLVALLAAALGFTACLSSSNAPSAPSGVPMGREFTLAPGQSATVGGLTVVFAGVGSDSRCPADVVCVWAGEALVNVSARVPGEAEATLSLRAGARAGEEAAYAGYTIRLVSLAPYPRASKPIAPGDYRATLTVSR